MSCQFVQSFVSIAPGKRGYRRSGNRVKNHMYGKATNQELSLPKTCKESPTQRSKQGAQQIVLGSGARFNCLCDLGPTEYFG